MALVGERLVSFATPCPTSTCKKPKACATTYGKIKSRNWPSNEKGLGEHIWFNRINLYHQNHTFAHALTNLPSSHLHLQQPFAYKASLKPPPPSSSPFPYGTQKQHPILTRYRNKLAVTHPPPPYLYSIPYPELPPASLSSQLSNNASWKVARKFWFCVFFLCKDRDRDNLGRGRGANACMLVS